MSLPKSKPLWLCVPATETQCVFAVGPVLLFRVTHFLGYTLFGLHTFRVTHFLGYTIFGLHTLWVSHSLESLSLG